MMLFFIVVPVDMMLTGNFYLFWLLLVTVAFLYNAAVGPLRTTFSRTPIYNVTGVYPASTATQTNLVADINCVNDTVTSNVTDAGTFCWQVNGNFSQLN